MINDPRTPSPALRPIPGKSSSKTVIKIIAAVIAILVGLLFGLIVLLLIGVETGPVALLIGMVSAILPVPIYLVLVLWIDRYEAEPAWMLATAFFCSAAISASAQASSAVRSVARTTKFEPTRPSRKKG